MKYFVLSCCLMLAAGIFLLAGCGKIQEGRLSAKTNKNNTKTVTLSGYSGGITGTGLAAAGSPVDEPQWTESESGTFQENQRFVTMDPKYASNSGFLEIKEKMFIAQTNDIYLNPEDYIGKTLKLEGIFQTQQNYTVNGNPYYFVIRYGPGCCGNDGNAGFEVMWDNSEETYPNTDDWVEAVGVLKYYEEDDYPYLCISLSSLTVLDERGAEFVVQ
ncbi:MAG: hypothetical protein LBD55_09585 [Treponema sp.]|jgi:uncharacterized membrane protein YcgQ (UPF0703/DUF1980 family)|nr:hypothetical protein [Treponema sp.]